MEDNHMDLKLDLVNWFKKESTENEQFFLLYYNKETGEIISALSPDVNYLHGNLISNNELPNKEEYRNFVLNAAVNIIDEYPDDYLQPMKEFVNSFKENK